MIYDVITFDTQVFYSNKRRLKGGLIGELRNKANRTYGVILTEIVAREIHKALLADTQEVRSNFEKTKRSSETLEALKDEYHKNLEESLKNFPEPDEHARKMVASFMNDAGVEIIRANSSNIDDITNLYFSGKPPFGTKGKKSEFPDAISLLSLESWAKKQGKKILAVTRDEDWVKFSEDSDYIDVVKELGEAMRMLVANVEQLIPIAIKYLNYTQDKNHFLEEFGKKLEDAVNDENPYLEFSSDYPGEEDSVYYTLASYEITELNDITIVSAGSDGFTFEVPIVINANVEAEISFTVRDSIDKDYIPIGSTTIGSDTDFEAIALLTWIKSEKFEPKNTLGDIEYEYILDKVQLVNTPLSVDIGHVDYHPGDEDYYDYDPN